VPFEQQKGPFLKAPEKHFFSVALQPNACLTDLIKPTNVETVNHGQAILLAHSTESAHKQI